MDINLQEAHFLGLPSQSNVYCLTKLCPPCSGNKLLIATLKRQIYSLEYARSLGRLIPTSKEVQFTYIPNSAEIISIDAFNKSEQSNDFVVGITFIQRADNQVNQYFNIYFDWEPGSEFNLDTIAQSGTSLALPFIPFHLCHTKLNDGKSSEVVWLLSGSDCQIHLYRENKLLHNYMEHPTAELFPEMEKLPSVVLSISIVHFDDKQERLTAIGCEGGEVRIAYINATKKEIISSWNICHDGPVTSIHLFSDKSTVKFPTDIYTGHLKINKIKSSKYYHVLVNNALEPTVVYRNVVRNGVQEQHLLPDSERFDCALCSCVGDVDMDGFNEIVLGTYGQELLVYKYLPESKSGAGYNLIWQRAFANPLQAVTYIDLTGDGLQELTVLSTKGIHILQHSLQDVANLCEDRLEHLATSDKFKEKRDNQET